MMGHPVLHDPEPVIGHRFRQLVEGQVMPWEHLLCNQLRMARKIFSDAVWFDWLDRYSVQQPAALWEAGWQQYLAGNESLERERAYLMANRCHDEFWYARTFGQEWPVTPYASGLARPRGPELSAAAPGSAGTPSLEPQLAAARAVQVAERATTRCRRLRGTASSRCRRTRPSAGSTRYPRHRGSAGTRCRRAPKPR